MCDPDPAVLGIDHKLYPHTTTALREHPLGGGVDLLEADSTSADGGGGGAAVHRRGRARRPRPRQQPHARPCARRARGPRPAAADGAGWCWSPTPSSRSSRRATTGVPVGPGQHPMTAVTPSSRPRRLHPRRRVGRRALVTESRDGILVVAERGSDSGARASTLERERQPFRRGPLIARAVTTPASGASVARHKGATGTSSTATKAAAAATQAQAMSVSLTQRPSFAACWRDDAPDSPLLAAARTARLATPKGEVRAEEEGQLGAAASRRTRR